MARQPEASVQSNIAAVAQAFATISEKAARAANRERLRIAEGNIAAGVGQLKLEETVTRTRIARSFARHQGKLAAEVSYRGGGGGDATLMGASAQASDEVNIAAANLATKTAALTASQAVILEDPFLAKLEGGLRGQQIASSMATSLVDQAEIGQRRSWFDMGAIPGTSGGRQGEIITTTFADVKGFDFGALLNF